MASAALGFIGHPATVFFEVIANRVSEAGNIAYPFQRIAHET